MKYISIMLLTVSVFILTITVCRAGETKTEVTLGLHFESTTGTSSSQIFNMVDSCLKVVMKNSALTIGLKKFASDQELMQAFLENKIDSAWLHPSEILKIQDGGGEIYSLGSYTIGKRRKSAECLWQKKDGPINDIRDVIGRKLLISMGELHLVKLRELLFEKGIDKPLWKVFDSFISPASSNSGFLAVAMGDADLYLKEDDFKEMLNLINPGLVSNVGYKFCSDPVYARYALIVNSKTVKRTEAEGARNALSGILLNMDESAKKEPMLKAVKQYTQLASMELIAVGQDEFDVEINLMKKARENGWLREAEFIVKEMNKGAKGKPVHIMPDFTTCKKWCAEEPTPEERETCLNKCME